jgi:hypothetical protein
MNVEDLYHVDNFAHFRDPMLATIGYHCDDSFGAAPCRFKWFGSTTELIEHIRHVELPLVCLGDRDLYEEYSGPLEQILHDVAATGFTEKLRESLNALDWGVTIDWWGSLEDLQLGELPFCRRLLNEFIASVGGASGVERGDIRAFSQIVRTCCEVDHPANDPGESCAPRDDSTAGLPPLVSRQ